MCSAAIRRDPSLCREYNAFKSQCRDLPARTWPCIASGCQHIVPKLDDVACYQQEYQQADKRKQDDTFLGQFILAAMSHKSMVTNKIFVSKNLLAGFSVDYEKMGFRGIRDFAKLVESAERGKKHE